MGEKNRGCLGQAQTTSRPLLSPTIWTVRRHALPRVYELWPFFLRRELYKGNVQDFCGTLAVPSDSHDCLGIASAFDYMLEICSKLGLLRLRAPGNLEPKAGGSDRMLCLSLSLCSRTVVLCRDLSQCRLSDLQRSC